MANCDNTECLFEMPQDGVTVNFPYDALTNNERFFNLSEGQKNSYYPKAVYYFFKKLPIINGTANVFLNLDGLCGVADIYIAGEYVATANKKGLVSVDISKGFVSGGVMAIRIVSTGEVGKYEGNGIAGGISLSYTRNPYYTIPNSVHVDTDIVGGKNFVTVKADVFAGDTTKYVYMYTEIYNQKNKRVTKKGKRIKVVANKTKTFDIKIKLSRAFEWTTYDPYTYSASVVICDDGSEPNLETADKVSFGFVSHELKAKSYRLNNKITKLKGVVLAHDNGIVGLASLDSAEERKIKALKGIGYNAVRYVGCPTQTALNTLDKLGMLCVVDIFDCLAMGRHSNDGHANFNNTWEQTVTNTVNALRNHPCVAFYSVCNDADESYGRGQGAELVAKIVAKIKALNSKALVTANARERAVVPSEFEKLGIKPVAKNTDNLDYAYVMAGREKDAFGKQTMDYFKQVDVAGYTGLYPRFATDKQIPERLLMALAEPSEKAVDLFDEVDKHLGVIGGFTLYGADFLGNADKGEKDYDTIKPCINTSGDLGKTLRRKSTSYYKEVALGKKDTSYMVVQDPDAQDVDGNENYKDTFPLWNWPRHVGESIKVIVHTSGDIVALFQDGKQISRKLAGKFNDNMAVFKINYYQGKLEAVSFHKGVECSRCTLETVTQPKSIKLECDKKTIMAGDTTFVDVACLDKEGRVVPYASREVTVEIEGEGEFVCAGNSDKLDARPTTSTNFAVYDGCASLVVRGTAEGKILVKVLADGLQAGKISIKVK